MIHATAIIDSKAKIGSNVTIGPYSIIKENVIIGRLIPTSKERAIIKE